MKMVMAKSLLLGSAIALCVAGSVSAFEKPTNAIDGGTVLQPAFSYEGAGWGSPVTNSVAPLITAEGWSIDRDGVPKACFLAKLDPPLISEGYVGEENSG